MSRTLRALLVIAAFASTLCFATVALAKPVGWASVDVTLHSETDGGVMVVAGELPTSTALPAQAELSVPKGASVVWIGEILGGPLSEDPSLEYTKRTAGDADVYLVTLSKSRTAQIEVTADPYTAMGASGFAASLVWPTANAVPQVRASIRVPAGAQVNQGVTGAELVPGDGTYDFYSTTLGDVKAGDSVKLAFTFTVPAAAAPVGAATSGSDTLLWVVLVLALVAGVALVVVAVAVRGTRRTAVAQDAEDEGPEGRPDTAAPGADDTEAEDAGPVPEESAARNPAAVRRMIVTAAVVVVFLIIAVVVGVESTKPRITGDTISKTFAGGEACATASIALSVPAGADAASTAETLFTTLKSVPSLTVVTYNLKASTLEVGYCESSTSEAALREALAPTGFVAATQ